MDKNGLPAARVGRDEDNAPSVCLIGVAFDPLKGPKCRPIGAITRSCLSRGFWPAEYSSSSVWMPFQDLVYVLGNGNLPLLCCCKRPGRPSFGRQFCCLFQEPDDKILLWFSLPLEWFLGKFAENESLKTPLKVPATFGCKQQLQGT